MAFTFFSTPPILFDWTYSTVQLLTCLILYSEYSTQANPHNFKETVSRILYFLLLKVRRSSDSNMSACFTAGPGSNLCPAPQRRECMQVYCKLSKLSWSILYHVDVYINKMLTILFLLCCTFPVYCMYRTYQSKSILIFFILLEPMVEATYICKISDDSCTAKHVAFGLIPKAMHVYVALSQIWRFQANPSNEGMTTKLSIYGSVCLSFDGKLEGWVVCGVYTISIFKNPHKPNGVRSPKFIWAPVYIQL